MRYSLTFKCAGFKHKFNTTWPADIYVSVEIPVGGIGKNKMGLLRMISPKTNHTLLHSIA